MCAFFPSMDLLTYGGICMYIDRRGKRSQHLDDAKTMLVYDAANTHTQKKTKNMVFSFTCYLELHLRIRFYYKCNFYRDKMLLSADVQTTNLTFFW